MRQLLGPVLVPIVGGLVFLVALLGLIGTAIRDPHPHDLAVGLVGPAPAVQQTSAMSTLGWVFSHSSYRCANATSACGERADSGSTSTGSS